MDVGVNCLCTLLADLIGDDRHLGLIKIEPYMKKIKYLRMLMPRSMVHHDDVRRYGVQPTRPNSTSILSEVAVLNLPVHI